MTFSNRDHYDQSRINGYGVIFRQFTLIDRVNLIWTIYKITEAIKDPKQIIYRLMMNLGL